ALGFCLILFGVLAPNSFGSEGPEFQYKPIEESKGTITLGQAVALALIQNPELAAFSWRIRALEANALQAGLLPNPDLDVEVENAGGTGKFSGLSQTETTIQMSQLIEIGNKRALRARAASLFKDLAGWDYETKRVDVLTQVSKAFTDVLGAQQQLDLGNDLVGLAQKVKSTASERVKAGKVSPIEEIKAKVALSSTRIQLDRAKRELEAARQRLAATWGSTNPLFKAAQGNLYSISPIPSLESLAARLSKNPDLARWTTEIAQRKAVVDKEKSKAIPNITLRGGFRRLEETDDNAFIFGVSVPLMIFDRNQGTIQKSLHQLTKAEVNQRAAEVRVNKKLADAYKALAVAFSEAETLKSQVLPGAQKAFDSINEGYRFGKFGFLDVLDSQRTLFQAKAQYLSSLTAYHKAIADVERLIGGALNSASLLPESK
ncbi:MAG: TolC family protein, partial [Nitrospinales bacterium]